VVGPGGGTPGFHRAEVHGHGGSPTCGRDPDRPQRRTDGKAGRFQDLSRRPGEYYEVFDGGDGVLHLLKYGEEGFITSVAVLSVGWHP